MVKVGEYELKEDLSYWPRGVTWAKKEPDGRIKVGITDLGQKLAQQLMFVRAKPKGTAVEQGKAVANIESQKWVGAVESPITGVVDEVNAKLRTTPKLINDDPYGEGWIAILKPTKPEEMEALVHGEASVEWYKKEIETRVKK